METIQKEFFDWLCAEFGFLAGKNAFQNKLPNTNQLGDQPVMWLIENSAYVIQQFHSHSKMKEYSFLLHYRDVRARDVELKVLELEQVLNHVHCFTLPSYKVISMMANSFGNDVDPDAEKFTRGSISITIRVLDNYEHANNESS